MSAIKYWLWLSAAAVSAKSRAALLDRYGEPEKAFFAPPGELSAVDGVSPRDAATLEKREIKNTDWIAAACVRQGTL